MRDESTRADGAIKGHKRVARGWKVPVVVLREGKNVALEMPVQ